MRIVTAQQLQQEVQNLFGANLTIKECESVLEIANRTYHVINSENGYIVFTNIHNYKSYFDSEDILNLIPGLESELRENNRISLNNSLNNSYFVVDNTHREFVDNMLTQNTIPYFQTNNPGLLYGSYLITDYRSSNDMDIIHDTEEVAKGLIQTIEESIEEKQILPNLFREV